MAATRYKKGFCDQLIKHMTQGYSFDSFPAVVGCCRRTLYNWIDKHPDFKKAKSKADAACLKFFEGYALAKMVGKKMNVGKDNEYNPKLADTTMLIFMLKTRFHKVYGDQDKQPESESGIVINYNVIPKKK